MIQFTSRRHEEEGSESRRTREATGDPSWGTIAKPAPLRTAEGPKLGAPSRERYPHTHRTKFSIQGFKDSLFFGRDSRKRINALRHASFRFGGQEAPSWGIAVSSLGDCRPQSWGMKGPELGASTAHLSPAHSSEGPNLGVLSRVFAMCRRDLCTQKRPTAPHPKHHRPTHHPLRFEPSTYAQAPAR